MNHYKPRSSSQTMPEINLIPRCVVSLPPSHAPPTPTPSYSCNLRDYKEMKKD